MTISNEQITAWKEAVKAATPGPTEGHDAGVLANDLSEALRLLNRIVRVFGDIQDGNGNTPTEIRRAVRFLGRVSAPLSDRTAGDEAKRSGPEQKPAETGG